MSETSSATARLQRYIAGMAGSVIGACLPSTGPPRVAILCYHSIHPSKSFASVTPEQFESHLIWLKTHTRVIPFRDASTPFAGDDSEHRVAITFDDGYADNYEYAAPLLAKHGLHATFFAVAGLIQRVPNVLERCRMLQKTDYESIRPMEWRHLREMQFAGLEIGSHTYSHPNLKLASDSVANWEMVQSRAILEQELGHPVRSLAYPFGNPGRHISGRTLEIASQAGYQYAASIVYRNVRQSDSRFAIPRFSIAGDSLTTLRAKVVGNWDFVGYCQERRGRRALSNSDIESPLETSEKQS